MKRVGVLVLIGMLALIGGRAAYAQDAQPTPPCEEQFEPGSVEYYQCTGEITVAPNDTLAEQQNMIKIIIPATLVFVGLIVGGSMMMSRRRLRNVPANEIRDLLRSLVPPEVGSAAETQVDAAVKELTTSPLGQEIVVVVVFIGMAAFAVSYMTTGFGAVTVAIVAVFLLVVLALAIRAVLTLARLRGTKNNWMDLLGIKIEDVPTIGMGGVISGGTGRNVYGGTVMAGTRYGRKVEITFGARGMNTSVTTHVAGVASPAFEIKGKDRDWQTKSVPPAVVDAVNKIGMLDRQVRLWGDANGVWVDRERNSTEATSAKGTVAWMKDVRLAEKIADAVK
jgi:hypothetical protein